MLTFSLMSWTQNTRNKMAALMVVFFCDFQILIFNKPNHKLTQKKTAVSLSLSYICIIPFLLIGPVIFLCLGSPKRFSSQMFGKNNLCCMYCGWTITHIFIWKFKTLQLISCSKKKKNSWLYQYFFSLFTSNQVFCWNTNFEKLPKNQQGENFAMLKVMGEFSPMVFFLKLSLWKSWVKFTSSWQCHSVKVMGEFRPWHTCCTSSSLKEWLNFFRQCTGRKFNSDIRCRLTLITSRLTWFFTSSSSSSSSSIPKPWGMLGHYRWFCNQFSPFFPVLHCPLGLAELQACPFPGVVFPPLTLSALSSSPFHCALQDGLARPDEWKRWPYHCSGFFTPAKNEITGWILSQYVRKVMTCLRGVKSISKLPSFITWLYRHCGDLHSRYCIYAWSTVMSKAYRQYTLHIQREC